MREIKFRAIPNKDFMINENQKNTLNSIAYYTKGEFYDDTFIYGYLADGYIIGKTIETGEEYFVPSYWIPVEKETIGQYTGLKDKNGKEIYEGDILEIGLGDVVDRYEVLWEGYGFAVRKRLTIKQGKKINKRAVLVNRVAIENHADVIGNIYENKELLEEK